tara:strand:+ start:37 stop:249 length:213 start_codon:yes stop_codon:yes gene_type:complete
MTTSDFDPALIKNYTQPKYLLHLQWGLSSTVYRYALVETIEPNKINSRTKQKEDEKDLTQKEIWENKYKK